MSGAAIFLYGVVAYVVFLASFVYSVPFVADVLVPLTIDRGREAPVGSAVVIDVLLLGAFAIQHTVMARGGFKRWLTSWMPEAIERSTYVLLSSACLALLLWQWRPIPAEVWRFDSPLAWWGLYALSAAGWVLVLTSTFAIDHWDLFGLRQVWLRLRGVPYTAVPMTDRWYYRIVRHPLMLGFIIAFWATPRMTAGHLLFAVATTAYILLAVKFFEEPDLVDCHGQAYVEYQQRVPMVCPWPRPRPKA